MTHDLNVLPKLLKEKLESGLPFSIVRFPDENLILENSELFLLPFCATWAERFKIEDDGPTLDLFFPSTERSEYINQVSHLIKELKANGHKVVISRIIDGRIAPKVSENLADNISRLFHNNPHAFAAVIRSMRGGLWVIVTPELLLKETVSTFKTVALAGTRKSGACTPWDKKNIREQRFVVDFIIEKWKQLGLSPRLGETETVIANNVEHICTPIDTEKNSVTVGDVIDCINPTPAVCGTPRDYAFGKIADVENHSRLLYAGAVAAKSVTGELICFVTLRCFHLGNDGRFNIFVGGGITGDSVPEDEWNETDMKALQILDCLLNNSND